MEKHEWAMLMYADARERAILAELEPVGIVPCGSGTDKAQRCLECKRASRRCLFRAAAAEGLAQRESRVTLAPAVPE